MMINWGAAGIGKKILGTGVGVALGVCELPAGSEDYIRAMSSTACLNARVSGDFIMTPGSADGPVKIAAAEGALGIHFSPLLAIQAKGRVRGISRFDAGDARWSLLPDGIKRESEHVILRIGNPALHSLRASLGEQRLPFGVDANPADDLWWATGDRFYWGKVRRSATLTFDNMSDSQVDLGFAGDKASDDSSQQASARLMYDLRFFERARLILSAAGISAARRFGFAFVTTSRAGATTQFELVRSESGDPELDAGFRRLFRFAYDAPDRRWWFLFDEDRLRTQTVATGYRYFPVEWIPGNEGNFAFRFSVGRVRSLNSLYESRFLVAVGVEAGL
ncbi:hypothetical protein EBZ80_10655 [bacterium]|nr:hypothetical protein [bacterium]